MKKTLMIVAIIAVIAIAGSITLFLISCSNHDYSLEIRRIKSNVSNLESDISGLEDKISEIEKKVDNIDINSTFGFDAESEIEQLKQEIQSLEYRIDDLESQLIYNQ